MMMLHVLLGLLMNSDNSKLVTFCCLGYNHGAYLAECLQSISAIGYDHIEVIVVDDGSADNSLETLHSLKLNFPYPLEIIAQENTGNIGRNFNNALNRAKGDFVAFIALDDVFNPPVLLAEIELMTRDNSLAFVASSKTVTIDDEGFLNANNLPELTLARLKNPTVLDCLELEYKEFGSFYIQGAIIRKKVIDQIGGFDEDMTGDDIVLRTKIFKFMLQSDWWNFKIVDKNSVFYRLHDNNINKNSMRQIKIVTEYLARYWPSHPNPPILISWVKHLIRYFPSEQYMKVFEYNERSAELLKDERILRLIKRSNLYKKFRMLEFIFSKKRFNNGDRNIRIFGILAYSYNKYSGIRSGRNKIHYSEIK